MIEIVLRTMMEYFGQDLQKTNHSLKVYSLARTIALRERLDTEKRRVLECAAALHDIGIPESLRTYGSAKAEYQEAMGYKVASELLTTLGFSPAFIQRVVFLIAHHHSYRVDGGIGLQILIEADILVSLGEGAMEDAIPEELLALHFRTKCGREMLQTMFGLQPQPPQNLIASGYLTVCEMSAP